MLTGSLTLHHDGAPGGGTSDPAILRALGDLQRAVDALAHKFELSQADLARIAGATKDIADHAARVKAALDTSATPAAT